LAAVAGIAVGVALLSRGPSRTPASSVPAVTAVTTPVTTSTSPRVPTPSTAVKARAAAERLAAALPVGLASTALVRDGSVVYAVGGVRRGGATSAGIWRLDPASGKVTRVATFIEPLTGAGVATRGGVLYLAGGWTGQKLATAVLRWVPGQAPSVVARLPVALRSATAGFSGSVLYVAKGAKVYAIDVASGMVKTAVALPAALRATTSNLDYLIQSLSG
jgi:hypothetical protein